MDFVTFAFNKLVAEKPVKEEKVEEPKKETIVEKVKKKLTNK